MTPTADTDLAGLADRIGTGDVGVVGILTEVGRIVVHATEEAAMALTADPAVAAVRSSIPLEPALTESTVVVGADVAFGAGFSGAGKVVVVASSSIGYPR